MEDAKLRIMCGVLAVVPLLAGCGGHKNNSGNVSPAETQEPIAECEAFEHAFAACTGREVDEKTHTASRTATGPERDRLRSLCIADLQRLHQACR